METDEHKQFLEDQKTIDEEREKSSSVNLSTSTSSSSPSHEFSFTLSLQNSSSQVLAAAPAAELQDKSKTAPFSAIDLSPADEIFFHGHLLPLHFLSHLRPTSSPPRHSTTSFDAFTLSLSNQPAQTNNNLDDDDDDDNYHELNIDAPNSKPEPEPDPMPGPNPKLPFSLFKWKKTSKLKVELSKFVKWYVEKVKPLLSSKGAWSGSSRREKIKVRRHSYSFSGILRRPKDNINVNNTSRINYEYDVNGRSFRRGGEFSAPASMRTSPTNSGHLVANVGITSSACSTPAAGKSHDSTMEELQAAIQAAIAHCKNSIANSHDKLNNV